jgi:putative ABC transport system permease protein
MLAQDLRFAWRTLVRQPAFTLVAVGTLALGLGANAAMFSVIRAVLLRPLPYPSPSGLVRIAGFNRETGTEANLSPADYMDFARDTRTLQRSGAHGWIGFFTIADGTGAPERVGGVNVTEGFFPTLGAAFTLGRSFTTGEDSPGGPRVVILSHDFWRRRFGADPAVVGRAIELNALPATVVGVLSPSFRHVEVNPERDPDVFVPYQFEQAIPNRGGHFIRTVGRLREGVSVEQARAELVAIADRLEREHPQDNTDRGVVVTALHEAVVSGVRPALLLLAAAVGFVLLVACANLANLLLAQGGSRRAELAVRMALGAGRGRLVRQLLTENLVIAGLGAVAALGLARAAVTMLTRLGAAGVPRAGDIAVDTAVLAFALGLAVIVALVGGLLPALEAARGHLHVAGRDSVRGAVRPGLHRPAREALVAAQVALALVLLSGAGLMVRSLWALLQVDPGFSEPGVLTFETAVPTATYAEGDQIPFYERFYDAIRALPGVEAVGAINILPLSANYDSRGVQIEALPRPVGQAPSIQARSVNPDYFRAMGIPLLRGRTFMDRDREGAPRVVVVSASMARRYWPGRDPIGQRLTFNSGIPRDEQQEVGGPGSREVVGIVGDVKHLGLDEEEVPMFYTPQAQQPSYHTMAVIVRAAADPAELTPAIREALARLDRGVPMYRVRTLDAVVRAAVSQPEMRAWLFGLFALLALALAAIGVYGVVAYVVGQRTEEIGIRLALGASSSRVLRAMLAEGLRPVAVGVAIGVIGSVATGRAVTRFLFGVAPADLRTYAVAVAALLLAASMATLIPALRVLRVDPATALRRE